jgi:hypothetical protein
VTEVGPTEVALGRDARTPGHRVIGVFNNVYAVRVLELSTTAMIEAPIRFYVTEHADGSADLSYKMASAAFSPSVEAAGPELDVIGAGRHLCVHCSRSQPRGPQARLSLGDPITT